VWLQGLTGNNRWALRAAHIPVCYGAILISSIVMKSSIKKIKPKSV